MPLKRATEPKLGGVGKTRDLAAAGRKVEKLLTSTHAVDDSLKEKIAAAANGHETQAAAKMDADQRAAVDLIVRNKYAVIEGPAGTGKTFIMIEAIKQIAEQVPLWNMYNHFSIGGTVDPGFPPGVDSPKSVPSIMVLAWQAKVAANARNRLMTDLKTHGEEFDMQLHASTIHNYLKYAPESFMHDETGRETTRFEPRYDAHRQSSCAFILLDEIGTVSEDLLEKLFAASPANTRIICFGDLSQLPPVAGRPVFPYMLTEWPAASLTRIYRQSADSEIIPNSQRILAGKMPIHAPDFIFDESVKLPGDAEQAEKFVGRYLIKAMYDGRYDPDVDMLMVHGNDSLMGRHRFNELLRTMGNGRFSPVPERRERQEVPIIVGKRRVAFTIGDRVVTVGGSSGRILEMPTGTAGIITSIEPNPKFESYEVDDSSLDWLDFDEDTADRWDASDGFDESEEVKVETQRQASHIMHITCPDLGTTVKCSTISNYNALDLNWSGTVHRNQGLQHPRAFIAVHPSFSRYTTREWLYTGVTRAISQVVLFHTDAAMWQLLNRRFYSGTTAFEKAERYIKNQRLRGNEDVELRENCKIDQDFEHVTAEGLV